MRPQKYDKFDKLLLVALVEQAQRHSIPPTTHLRNTLGMRVEQAKYYLRVLRKDGLVPEQYHHRPARAVVHRGTPRERAWLVCEECLIVWPCLNA